MNFRSSASTHLEKIASLQANTNPTRGEQQYLHLDA